MARCQAPQRKENLSPDADVFFADGMQDDVLTSLGKIKGLIVIARTSVMGYRGALAGRLREMGETLSVSHVLEGSVRRVADRVVVNVALIDTRDERQLWSQRYERTLTDTLSLLGELAVEIARALQASLTPTENTLVASKPTENPEAYLLYLRAREAELVGHNSDPSDPAIQLYQQAIDLDPSFALARARLSICANELFRWPGHSDWKAKARSEAEEALRLRPDLGEARLAMTYWYVWGEDDNERGLAELARTAELLPNSAEVPLTAAFIYKRQNRYRERLVALQRAEALDPRNTTVLTYLALTYRWVRDWPEAIRARERIAAIASKDLADRRRWVRANLEFQLRGDLDSLKNSIAEQENERAAGTPDWLKVARYETAMFERDYAAAASLLPAITPQGLLEAVLPVGQPPAHSKAFHEALFAVARGADAAAKHQALEAARIEVEASLTRTGLGDDQTHADLGLIFAFLGRKEEAIREAQRAAELLPGSAGTIEKNDMSAALALVHAQTGEGEKAITHIS